MIQIDDLIETFSAIFVKEKHLQPWTVLENLPAILNNFIEEINSEFEIKNGIAVHKTANIEAGVFLKPPVIINKNCFISTNAYLRNGVYLAEGVKIGPGCEIKTSIIFPNSSIAHFNFIGDSIIGSNVNFEAGSLIANHYNERADKKIYINYNSKIIDTGVEKFGALVGDNAKIGANAVLSPGTILPKHTIVKRLELINQVTL